MIEGPTRDLPGECEPQALVSQGQNGAIANETLYERQQRGEIARSERSYEDEMKLIDTEDNGTEEERMAALPSKRT